MKAITIQNLSKTYANGTRALTEVNIEVEAGDFFALLGANGAGKTTIIGILTGLVNKTAGKAVIYGHDIDREFEAAKRMMGVVPQEFNFNMFEKIQDILVTQAGYYGIERSVALTEAESLLKRLGLWEKRHHPARSLSGGMKRRLMIARALVHRPQLLILDEPTAGVDVELRYGMWDYLKQLNQEGRTILLTTHYLEEVEQLCRHAAMIKEGKIIKHDAVKNMVKMMDRETYVVAVRDMRELSGFVEYNLTVVDSHSFEVELNRTTELDPFLAKLKGSGFVITDIRPKGHRLEKLFLDLLKK